MPRVTVAEVKNLVKTDLDVALFIEAANLIVDEELVGRGLSENRLRLIELNLSAHYAAIAEERGQIVKSELGESAEWYGGKFTEGLKLTRFGQQALHMDTSGRLAETDTNKTRALFDVV